MGTQLQVQVFARGLQADGRQDEAMELFRVNIKKDPNSWVGHNEAARVAVAQGDFETAIKEMKLAVPVAPKNLKAAHMDLVRRLQNHQDINKNRRLERVFGNIRRAADNCQPCPCQPSASPLVSR